MMHDLLIFTLVVGIGSTFALDIWVTLLERLTGLPATNWGMVGRWLDGLSRGQFVLDGTNSTTASGREKAIGWLFHYAVGLAYAFLIPLLWGADVMTTLPVLPFVVIGLVASTAAGLVILYPGMGGGLFASRLPNQAATIVYLIVAHAVFAASQYGMAHVARALT